MTDDRNDALETLADQVCALRRSGLVRVAVDGVDAAGKTTLVNELAVLVETRGRPVQRASVDTFHRPPAERYRRGRDSPEGYYEDSFDYEAVRAFLLGATGPPQAILLFDGIFLFRPELDDLWNFRVFLDVDFDEVLRRALVRDEGVLGSPTEVRRLYLERYIPGQRLYLEAVQPARLADVVVENSDPDAPVLRR